jgi:hypothetical protein
MWKKDQDAKLIVLIQTFIGIVPDKQLQDKTCVNSILFLFEKSD